MSPLTQSETADACIRHHTAAGSLISTTVLQARKGMKAVPESCVFTVALIWAQQWWETQTAIHLQCCVSRISKTTQGVEGVLLDGVMGTYRHGSILDYCFISDRTIYNVVCKYRLSGNLYLHQFNLMPKSINQPTKTWSLFL